MFLFLMLLISCWAVAVTLVTKVTNAGVIVFVPEVDLFVVLV